MPRMKIKRGDPQPKDCPICKSNEGYQVTDLMKGRYTEVYLDSGQFYLGGYFDSEQTTREGSACHCPNCLTRLPFDVEKT